MAHLSFDSSPAYCAPPTLVLQLCRHAAAAACHNATRAALLLPPGALPCPPSWFLQLPTVCPTPRLHSEGVYIAAPAIASVYSAAVNAPAVVCCPVARFASGAARYQSLTSAGVAAGLGAGRWTRSYHNAGTVSLTLLSNYPGSIYILRHGTHTRLLGNGAAQSDCPTRPEAAPAGGGENLPLRTVVLSVAPVTMTVTNQPDKRNVCRYWWPRRHHICTTALMRTTANCALASSNL